MVAVLIKHRSITPDKVALSLIGESGNSVIHHHITKQVKEISTRKFLKNFQLQKPCLVITNIHVIYGLYHTSLNNPDNSQQPHFRSRSLCREVCCSYQLTVHKQCRQFLACDQCLQGLWLQGTSG